MALEQGLVKEVKGERAILRVQGGEGCSRCSSGGVCYAMGDREMQVDVANRLNARVGDVVEFSSPSAWALRMSVLVYGVPILLLLLGAFGGSLWAEPRGWDPSLASLLGGILGLGVSFALLWVLGRGRRRGVQREPVMTRIVSAANGRSCCPGR